MTAVMKQQFIELINGIVKDLNIKNGSYYFYDDMINIKIFQSNLLKIDKKPYKDFDIYYIGYITIKKLINLVIMKIFIA